MVRLIQGLDINYVAVLVATIANMIVGGFWYSPAVFGNTWLKIQKFSPKQTKKMRKSVEKNYALGFLVAIVTSFVLAVFLQYTSVSTASQGAGIAFWLWFGFMMPVTIGSVLWEGKPLKLFFINASYQLVSLVLMASILAVW